MSQAANFSFNCAMTARTIAPFALPSGTRDLHSLESMMLMEDDAAAKAGDLIGVLLSYAVPAGNFGCEVLRPLWAEEAMHRVHGFVRLLDARRLSRIAGMQFPAVGWREAIAARDLAILFKELETAGERAALPCAAILRDVIAGIGILFGRAANVEVAITTESVQLPGYQRRALVLAATELVNNALLHAFPKYAGGRIELALTRRGGTSACLSVADNGIGLTGLQPDLARGVAAGLADLLEADLAYDRSAGWTIAEIVFPVPGF